jgi:ATP-dependent Clp protease adaptor protein ClpS
MSRSQKEFEGSVLTDKKQEVDEPSLYKVILHNDDYTTMDFVVLVLEVIFHKNSLEANRIMLNVHQQGVGMAGVYPRDVAETKVIMVHELARQQEFPLKCSIEKV